MTEKPTLRQLSRLVSSCLMLVTPIIVTQHRSPLCQAEQIIESIWLLKYMLYNGHTIFAAFK